VNSSNAQEIDSEFELTLSPYEPPMVRSAQISEDGRYRYLLTRSWRTDLPVVCFVMLNPSSADASVDDPTIRRCIDFARRWGYGGLTVVNLYAFRTPSPAELFAAHDPVGCENDDFLATVCARASAVVAAWGAKVPHPERKQAAVGGVENLKCLGTNRNGEPRHPLYVRADAVLQTYSLEA
jgi:hypothetical protein